MSTKADVLGLPNVLTQKANQSITDVNMLHSGLLAAGTPLKSIHVNKSKTYFIRFHGDAAGHDEIYVSGETIEGPIIQVSASGGAAATTLGDVTGRL